MMTVYIGVTMFFLMFWMAAAFITFEELVLDGDKQDRYLYFGVGTLVLIGILIWPLTLGLAIPAGMVYGLYSLVQLGKMKRRGELI